MILFEYGENRICSSAALKPQIFSVIFSKEVTRKLKKTFSSFFHVTISNIIEVLSYFYAYLGYFWAKMKKISNLSLNYERIRFFSGKGALTSWNINTLGDSIWIWGKSYLHLSCAKSSNIFCHFLKRGHREVEKNFFKFFSCYYI